VFSITTFDGLTMGFGKPVLLRHECKHTAVPRTRVPSVECGCGPSIPSRPWLLKHVISIEIKKKFKKKNTQEEARDSEKHIELRSSQPCRKAINKSHDRTL